MKSLLNIKIRHYPRVYMYFISLASPQSYENDSTPLNFKPYKDSYNVHFFHHCIPRASTMPYREGVINISLMSQKMKECLLSFTLKKN